MEMQDLEKYLPKPFMKGNSDEKANRKVRYQELNVSIIQFEIKDRLPSSMSDELEDNQ